MKDKNKRLTILWISIALVILGMVAVSIATVFLLTKTIVVDKATAECIGNRSTLYILAGCIYCEHQLSKFGDNKIYLNIIDCRQDMEPCINSENFTGVPFWEINGSTYKGDRDISELKRLIGC
jgi:hypothetical protein